MTRLALALAFALLFAQMGGRADTLDPLSYSGGFLVTGDYVASGVDLHEDTNPVDAEGLATGTIHISGVPQDADIVAAYLYWETITFTATPTQARAKFRGEELDLDSIVAVKKSHLDLTGNVATCWTSGQPVTMWHYRADVLRFLPMRLDSNDKPTGKLLVNDDDLTTNAQPLHTVSLPTRNGNQLPESAGATLVLVYRDPAETVLRKVVLYDGTHVAPALTDAMTQTLRGFYRSATAPSAKITHLIASGQPNNNERIFFNDGTSSQISAANPVFGGSSSERAWSTLTYPNLSMTPGNNSAGGYGETATTTVDHSGGGGYDCLTWGAVVFSTAVEDFDHDGLPDGLEDVSGGLKDPDNTQLPNLKAMGAGSDQKDAFIEVNAMWAPSGTSYGSPTAPYSTFENTKTTTSDHTHMPTPDTLKMIGKAYGDRGIRVHFDVGNVTAYHNLGVVHHTDWTDDYGSADANQYLVGNGVGNNVASLARGGETVKETACAETTPGCQFPAYPGTVSWKIGVQLLRDWPVGDAGQEISLDPTNPAYFNWEAGTHRRRFDTGRTGLFHYLLYAHARGTPRSLPCLVHGDPAAYDLSNGTACSTPNPQFIPLQYHVPTSASGIADLPGETLLVTLGLWEEFVGRPFTRAGTTFHELGHNLELWHGGGTPTFGNKGLGIATYIEPNCKPYYLTSMSYLFQVHGLFNDLDEIHIDYSSNAYAGAAETGTVADGFLSPTPLYQPAWFAPATSVLAGELGVTAATRFCNGTTFNPAPTTLMARVHTTSVTGPTAFIDWNGDKVQNNSLSGQDANFDNTVTGAPHVLGGFDDWGSLRLNQVNAAVAGILPGSAERIGLELGGLTAEMGGIAAEMGGISPSLQGLSAEMGGLTAEMGGLYQLWNVSGALNGLTAEMGGLTAEMGGLVAMFPQLGGLSAEMGGLSAEMGGLSAEMGGLSAEMGGLSAEMGGSLELSFAHANELGKSRPYQVKACVIQTDNSCSTAATFTALYHRVLVTFNSPPFGSFSSYQVQRKRAGAPDSSYVSAGPSVTTNIFIDLNELADGAFNSLQYVYRVRGIASDGNSEWSRPSAPLTTVNDKPQAGPDGPFTVNNKSTLPIVIATLLANDTDDDSPTAYLARRLTVTQQPVNGTLTLNGAGTILTYKPNKNYVGPDSFKYRSDDGMSSDTPAVPLSAPSNEITISITVTK